MFSFSILSRSLATIAYILDIISINLLSNYGGETSKLVSMNSIPTIAIDLLLPTIEKYHNMKVEKENINVSLLKYNLFQINY